MPTEEERQAAQIARVLKDMDRPFSAAAEDTLAIDPSPDRTRRFTHISFARMRTSWREDERVQMQEIRRRADKEMLSTFPDAYELLGRIYAVVRIQDETDGVPRFNNDGSPRWKLNHIGRPVEDWTRLGDQQRDDFIHEIVVHSLEWAQRADALWMDAMMAKGLWEEMFAAGYTAPADRKLTIDDRTQAGIQASMEDRYFAIFQAALSKRAEDLVRHMGRIEQRMSATSKL